RDDFLKLAYLVTSDVIANRMRRDFFGGTGRKCANARSKVRESGLGLGGEFGNNGGPIIFRDFVVTKCNHLIGIFFDKVENKVGNNGLPFERFAE
ncbi:unnamed protein product, partial [Ilex paraguariensis]